MHADIILLENHVNQMIQFVLKHDPPELNEKLILFVQKKKKRIELEYFTIIKLRILKLLTDTGSLIMIVVRLRVFHVGHMVEIKVIVSGTISRKVHF